MLLTTVLLWALNLSVTKYILTHGLGPLPYATVRYGLAALVFVTLTLLAERTLRIERRHLPLVALATVALWLNQLSFVISLDLTTASTTGLVLVALGAGGEVSASRVGIALGLATGATWALYSVTIVPLMRAYSPSRISAV